MEKSGEKKCQPSETMGRVSPQKEVLFSQDPGSGAILLVIQGSRIIRDSHGSNGRSVEMEQNVLLRTEQLLCPRNLVTGSGSFAFGELAGQDISQVHFLGSYGIYMLD